jgi:hypothetical protein
VALKLSFPKLRNASGTPSASAAKSLVASKLYKSHKNSRFVLFLGDEGAILVHLKGREVISRQFVPDASQQNLDELLLTLKKDPKAPVLMVIDSMDQSYVQQTLPPVSSLSVGKLIKRRLDRDFAANDIKGALILGRENTQRKDWSFMMIAQERSPQLDIWLDFVRELPHRFLGIRLVAVEVEKITKVIHRARHPSTAKVPEWTFFLSHHKVSGFRQVILRNGRIVFTRLAQPLADANPEVMAGNIEQEVLSTIEYMKRLAFNPQAGLEIISVTSQAIRESIDYKKFNTDTVSGFTPFELAQQFGIIGATQTTDQFGDVVMAALIGAGTQHALPLSVPQFRKIDQCYQLIAMQRYAAALLTLGLIGFIGNTAYEIYTVDNKIVELEREKESNQRTLGALKEEIKRTNLDVERSTDLIDLYGQLKQEHNNPYEFIRRLQPLIAPPLTLKSIEWVVSDTRPVSPQADAAASPPAATPAPNAAGGGKTQWIQVNLVLELPGIASDTRKRMAIINKTVKDFSDRLPGYEISADKSLIDQARETEQNRSLSSSRETIAPPPTAEIQQDVLIEEKITIIGPIVPPPLSAAKTDPVTPDAPVPQAARAPADAQQSGAGL